MTNNSFTLFSTLFILQRFFWWANEVIVNLNQISFLKGFFGIVGYKYVGEYMLFNLLLFVYFHNTS